jgi:hypothetical protein
MKEAHIISSSLSFSVVLSASPECVLEVRLNCSFLSASAKKQQKRGEREKKRERERINVPRTAYMHQ